MSTDGISALERGHRRTPLRETLALLVGALALDDEQRRDFEAAARLGAGRRLGGASVTIGPWAGADAPALPLALTRFIGRAGELDEIAALIREHRLVTLTGSGGVGKTQTALRVANALGDGSAAAVYFVGLAPLGDGSLIAHAIASALCVQEVPNRPLLETLIAYLRTKALLLILDNCEHLIDEAGSVAYQLLLNCPNLRIIATSREALRTAGERAYRLPSLQNSEAVELFVDRARAADYHFALGEEDSAIVADLCRRLDGIPLAIEMAAARVQMLTPREMVATLERQFGLFRGGDRAAPTRQQTMWATLDWSYQLLSKPEKALFDRLSVFVGGCTLELTMCVCADEGQESVEIHELLASLVNKSLLTVDRASPRPRYVMLETARQFARERLAEGGKQQLLAQRHATAMVALAERFDQARRHESEQVALALAEAEQDNVRAALQWALGDGHDVLSGQRIVGLLAARFWAEILSAREGLGWMTRALELADERTPVEVRARLHYALAVALPHLCQYDKQLVASQHATDLFRAAGDSVMEANARQVHAAALEMLGRTSEARAILEELLPFARRMKNHSRWSRGFLVVVLWRLANVRACQNDLTAARRLIAEAKQTEEAAGPVDFVAAAREESWIEFLAGDPERALALFTEVVLPAIREEPGEWTAGALEDLVNYLIALTRFGEAAEVAHEMLALTAKFGDLADSTAAALQHLATIAAERPAKSDEDAQAKLRNAARILGYADARTQTLKARRRYYLQAAYERVNALLRNALGEDTLAQLMEAGAAMSEEDAVRLALCAN